MLMTEGNQREGEDFKNVHKQIGEVGGILKDLRRVPQSLQLPYVLQSSRMHTSSPLLECNQIGVCHVVWGWASYLISPMTTWICAIVNQSAPGGCLVVAVRSVTSKELFRFPFKEAERMQRKLHVIWKGKILKHCSTQSIWVSLWIKP